MSKPNGWQLASMTNQVWQPPGVTEWETLLSAYGLTESAALGSPIIRRWIQKNCRRRYVPEKILDALCIEVTYEWGD